MDIDNCYGQCNYHETLPLPSALGRSDKFDCVRRSCVLLCMCLKELIDISLAPLGGRSHRDLGL